MIPTEAVLLSHLKVRLCPWVNGLRRTDFLKGFFISQQKANLHSLVMEMIVLFLKIQCLLNFFGNLHSLVMEMIVLFLNAVFLNMNSL